MCGQEFIGTAPVNLLFCIDWRRLQRWAELEKAPYSAHKSFRHFWISFQDTIITAQNIGTAADAVGLGSCYIGTVMEMFRELRTMFDLPDLVVPVVLLCLGYPKFRPEPKRKLGVETVVHEEKYREQSDDDLLAAFRAKYPSKRMEITKDRLERIEQACLAVHGREFTAECLAAIKEQNDINVAQRYFGLHYTADTMPDRNDDFIKTIKEFGFGWFEKYEM
jgi:FMN reductase [NAD(P)H]